MELFTGKTVVILTGASKGIGRAIAYSLAREFAKNEEGKKSVFVLVARSKTGLEETKKVLTTEICPDILVQIVVGDLGDLSNLPKLANELFSKVVPSEFTSALLVNNAGSLGDPRKTICDFSDVHEIDQSMQLNITSPFYLTSSFLNTFSTNKRFVINITSICSITPAPSLPLYCTSKAGREMLFRVLAEEAKDVRVLNYSPGPVETDMFNDIVNNCSNAELKVMLRKTKETGVLLTPETSAGKMITLLKQDRYTSGLHIDYFDELP